VYRLGSDLCVDVAGAEVREWQFSGARYIHGVNAAAGGWEAWSWDESLFAGAAGYYEQGRLPYAPGLADAFARSLALDGQGRLLDVGCGPGSVTLRLAPLFEVVAGLDPDAEMLARASRAAAEQGVGTTRAAGPFMASASRSQYDGGARGPHSRTVR
jgi:SAM-dependent methyltransferase